MNLPEHTRRAKPAGSAGSGSWARRPGLTRNGGSLTCIMSPSRGEAAGDCSHRESRTDGALSGERGSQIKRHHLPSFVQKALSPVKRKTLASVNRANLAVCLELVLQTPEADAEELRRLGSVVPRPGQRLQDISVFELLH